MKLLTAVNQYVNYRKSLGEYFEDCNWKLKAFVKAMGPKINLTEVNPDSVSKFLAGRSPVITSSWHSKHYALRGFYKYLISRGYIETSPLPLATPKQPPRSLPYIYNVNELNALFNACFSYQRIYSQFDPFMVHMLLLLVYGAGLRIREAINLKLADVDLNQSLLTIRETKFYKTRFVPIGEELTHALKRYVVKRKLRKYPQDFETPFFVGRNGKSLNQSTVGGNFRRIRKKANIRRTDGAHFQPRIHDLRHTFAVHRLTAWYKEGADVQYLLPLLSIYLGHTTLAATSTYLTMTPALLEEAGHRFEQYILKETLDD
jgi:site-specific recombinase XerD